MGGSSNVGTSAQARWLYGPWTDLIIGCAAWSAPLLAFAGRTSDSVRGWAVVFYLLALAFNYPHYMATVYRAYHTRSEFARYRIFTLHLTALLALTAVLSHAWSAVVPWIFTIYITWSPWHYTGQNFGLAMMYARRNGVGPTTGERRALHLAFLASYLLLFVSFHTGPSNDQLIRSIGLPEALANPARLALFGVFVACGATALTRMSIRAGLPAMLAPFTLFAAQFVWFVAPAVAEWATGVRLQQARYSSGALAIMHSAQYLWITSYYARREAESTSPGGWRPWSYAGTLLAGGIALFVPGPWLASFLFRVDFTTSVLIFTAIVNIHHFILDGAIWKLRDSRIAALLIDSPRRATSAAADAGRAVRGVTAWLVSDVAGARILRVATLVVLCAWAAIDQARFVMATDATNPDALARAAALNPYDLSVLSRRAQLLVDQQRYQEAYDLYQSYLSRRPTDVQALLAQGVLLMKLGRADDAVENWQRALDADPKQPDARRYLAQIWANTAEKLEEDGKALDAARAYLEALALDQGSNDRINEGIDWFNYGQFLKRTGREPRLTIACLLKAEALLSASSDPRLATARQVRADLERNFPEEAAAVRKDPATILATAAQRQ